MNLEDVNKIKIARKPRKRVGRGNGSGHGKTCGRGHGGQKSRSGYKRRAGFEGGQMPLVRRMPKRGFNNVCRKTYAIINVADLERFEDGTEVGPEQLRTAGLVKGKYDGIKVLGNGALTKKLRVRANRFSVTATEKIQTAGGSAEVLG